MPDNDPILPPDQPVPGDPEGGDEESQEGLDPVINGISQSQIFEIVDELGTDPKQLIQVLWLKGFLGAGAGGLWENPKLTTETVGGCAAGSDLVGLSVLDILEEILYGFQKPRFTTANISTFKTIMEVGEPVGANGVLTFGLINAENVEPGSMVLVDHNGNIIARGFDTSPQQLTFPEWTNKSIKTTAWTLKAKNVQGAEFSIAINISWQALIHYGESDNANLDAIGVQGLRESALSTRFNNTYEFNAGGYKYVAFPSSFGTPTKYDNPENNMEVPVTDNGVLQVTNKYGVEMQYKVIRTTLSLKGDIKVRVA